MSRGWKQSVSKVISACTVSRPEAVFRLGNHGLKRTLDFQEKGSCNTWQTQMVVMIPIVLPQREGCLCTHTQVTVYWTPAWQLLGPDISTLHFSYKEYYMELRDPGGFWGLEKKVMSKDTKWKKKVCFKKKRKTKLKKKKEKKIRLSRV